MPQDKAKPEITVDGATFYSAEHAGEMLGLSKRTIMRYLAQGVLQGARVGPYVYLPAPELRRLLTEGDRGKARREDSESRGRPKGATPLEKALSETQRAAHKKRS